MGYRVDFSRRAERDLEAAVRFLARKSPQAAVRIGEALVDQALFLAAFPKRGAPVKGRTSVRKIPYRHYVLFYRVDEKRRVVEILRIWDNRRDPQIFAL